MDRDATFIFIKILSEIQKVSKAILGRRRRNFEKKQNLRTLVNFEILTEKFSKKFYIFWNFFNFETN